jgi:hypothetical protein
MPRNGDGNCYECENGDWYCPGENGNGPNGCPQPAGPGWEKIGTAWLPLDLFRRHGFVIYVNVHCKEDGSHKVDLFLEKVVDEVPFKTSIAAPVFAREVEVVRRLGEQTWLVNVQAHEEEDDDEGTK